jgi:aminoglycoside 6'-N-acetyltransferase
MTAPAIAFRPFDAADFQQVFLWLIRPHVARGYGQPPGSFMEFVAKFGPRTRPDNAVKAWIVTIDGRDAGYIQTYRIDAFPDYAAQLACDGDAAGVDLFIGEESLTHRGYGPRALERFVEDVVFAQSRASCCIAGPLEGNRESIRAFEKAGFRHWKTVQVGESAHECVMRRDREAVK